MPIEIPCLHLREPDVHKREVGQVFIVAGSRKMSGAAFLTAEATLRSGAGYVCVGMPASIISAATANPRMTCVLLEPLPETDDGVIGIRSKEAIARVATSYDIVAVGPGISTDPQTQKLVVELLPELQQGLVIDADGLNAIAKQEASFYERLNRGKGLPVLTPHAGEFARLVGKPSISAQQQVREDACRDFAARHTVVCVLKGHRTVVSDGERIYTNHSGNPGMATAGSGDALTGSIAALRAQGYDSFEAAVLGAYLHGLAGDLCAAVMGEYGMTAMDLLTYLPHAFKKHAADKPGTPPESNQIARK